MEQTREELEKKYGLDLSPVAVRKRVIRDVITLLAAGFVYYILVKYTPFSGRCYVKSLTGYDCPACGVTRMMLSIVKLDFKKAFLYNPYIFCTFPYVTYEIAYFFYLNESKKLINKMNQIILFIWLGGFIVFGILRNII